MSVPAAPRDVPPDGGAGPRLLLGALLACAAAAIALVAGVAAARLGYPFELEWMEGAMVDHAARVRDGLPVYCAPSPDHVPFLYTPLPFWLGGALMGLGVDGLLALRLVSFAAAAAIALLAASWVRRETGSARLAFVAAGLFAAGTGFLAWWYDLARNDTLFVVFVLATAWLVRFHGVRGAVTAGGTAALAFLAKQSAVMWLPAIAVGALLLDLRRGAWFCAAAAAGVGAAVLGLHLGSDGWSTFFVFTSPATHGVEGSRKLGFWTSDVVPLLPLVLLALGAVAARWRDGRRGEALFLAALGGGALATSWLTKLHVGGFDNAMMPALVAGCVLGPLALAAARGPWRTVAAALLLAQFSAFAFDVRSLWEPEASWPESRTPWLLDPRRVLPAEGHRRAHEELLAFVRAEPGEVLVLGHGDVTARAGKPRTMHGQALFDLLQMLHRPPEEWSPEVLRVIEGFAKRLDEDLARHRWSAIVLDAGMVGYLFEDVFAKGIRGNYRRREKPTFLTDPRALRPPIGFEVHSPYVLEPVR